MKNIITAAALALGLTLTAAAPVKAMGVDFCEGLSLSTGVMALLRDEGYSPQEVYDDLLQNGIPEDIALILLKLVYVDAPLASPQALTDEMFEVCMAMAQET